MAKYGRKAEEEGFKDLGKAELLSLFSLDEPIR